MNRKIIRIVEVILIIGLVWGGIYIYKESKIKSYKTNIMKAIEEDKYTEALEILKTLIKQEESEENLKLKEVLELYLEAEKLYKDEKYSLALSKILKMDSIYEKYPIVKDIKSLKRTLEERLDINNTLEKVENLIIDKKFKEGKKRLVSIDKTLASENQKKKIKELEAKLNKEMEKELKGDIEKKKGQYLNKINELKDERRRAMENLSNAELEGAYRSILDKWYLLYRNIVGEVEKKLNEKELLKFRKDEVTWRSNLKIRIDEILVGAGSGIGNISLGEEMDGYKGHCLELISKYFNG